MRACEPPEDLGAAPRWRLPLPSPPLSNRDAAASRVGGNRRPEPLTTTNPGKPRGHFCGQPRFSKPRTTNPNRLRAARHASASANRLQTSKEGDADADKMAAAAAQGGRSGGGGSSGAGGGSSCGTGSGRSGLLDKVRGRSLGTVEAWRARQVRTPSHPRPLFFCGFSGESWSGPPWELYGHL